MSIGSVISGKTRNIITESPTASGTTTQRFNLEGDSLVVSLFVSAISGTLDVTVNTYAPGISTAKTDIIVFDQVSSTTSELVIRSASTALSEIEVVVTYSAACTYSIAAKSMTSASSIGLVGGAAGGLSGGLEGTLTVTSTAALAKVGSSNLANRLLVTIFNDAPDNVYWGYNSTVTYLTGTPIHPGECKELPVGPANIYLVAKSGNKSVRITEGY